MHARTSGLADYMAEDEQDAIRIGRRIMARLNWRKSGPGPTTPPHPPVHDPDQLLGIASVDPKVPFDPRDVIARVVDGSAFDESKPLYGTSLVTGWASIHGFPVGILANARGESDRHPPHLPAEHHWFHGRCRVRAGRHHQGRRQDDQRRVQQHSSARDHHHGCVLRCRELRHVRAVVLAAFPIRLA